LTRARLVAVLAGAVLLEAVAVGILGPSGRRVRLFVDLLAVEGLVLGMAGAFLAADRPFLAARAMARRVREDPDNAPEAPGERDRSTGWTLLLGGGALFAIAAGIWSRFGA
jgi:hypothetical protein